jgi:adenine-specific DNA-methyltransferase
MTHLHPIQRRYLAEDLVRRRRADEQRRSVASQRSARIDANPHQIDAVIFALARLPDGGCILADEVGLGKTIEAGLVIAQLLSEGATRILIVAPKALLGQWKQELFTLFNIDAREVTRAEDSFSGQGVFLATRDFAGGETGAPLLQAADRFDLCVIDEAHEVFAGIYKRIDSTGTLREESRYARMAARLSQAIRGSDTPILLLTATPIQNSLLELWGLVHYIDPTGTLLGDLPTFRDLFCPDDERVLAEGQEHELHRRLETVLKRTLRRQAQDFLSEPFVGRQTRLFRYTMSPEERALYDDVTSYLLEPNLHAFRGNQRRLLLLGFLRRMASSHAALRASLERVAARLRRRRDDLPPDDAADREAFLGDLEEDEEPEEDETAVEAGPDRAGIAAELARVESFIARAGALPTDSKGRALLQAIQLVGEQAAQGKSSGKVVIFTESRTTQDYVRKLLREGGGIDDNEITLFRGNNDSPRALQALAHWNEEVGAKLPADSRPSPDVAIRLALVHEFRHRSRIFISTEAGAKGLNLQFASTVVNYDLPWNPQRIEQRIGRCHRYGQQRDVTVINFLAGDNEAQQLTFEILSRKLDLFGTVLGASDEVLHRPGAIASEALAGALGSDFEAQLRRIYDRARSIREVERELRELRDAMDSKRQEFELAQRRTEEIIRSRFDATVRQVFRRIQEELPAELAELDRHLERVVTASLEAAGVPHRIERHADRVELIVDGEPVCLIGNPVPSSPLRPLHLGHPLVQEALAEARTATDRRRFAVRITAGSPETKALRGRRGALRLVRIRRQGFESTEQILPLIVLAGETSALDPSLAGRLLMEPTADLPAGSPAAGIADEVLDDALEEIVFADTGEAGDQDQPRFERRLEQIERFIGDRVLLLERRKKQAAGRSVRAGAARDAALGAEPRERAEQALRRSAVEIERLEAEIARLRAGDDDSYQRWRRQAQERRYTPPEVATLLAAEIEIA